METKLQKIYLSYCNLLIAQDLWEAHCQMLSIIFLKEFTKLNVSVSTMTKNVQLVELHMKYATVFLNIQTSKMI